LPHPAQGALVFRRIINLLFQAPDEFQGLVRAAQLAGVPFLGFWLEAPQAMLEARVAGRRNDASDADVTIVRAQAAMPKGATDWVPISAADDVEMVAARIMGHFRGRAVG